MKKKWLALLLTVVMLLSLAAPTLAEDDGVMTFDDLAALDADYASKLPADVDTTGELTWDAAIAYLLRDAGMEESQLGTYPSDYEGMADSLGMIDESDFDGTLTITVDEFNALAEDDGLLALYEALETGEATEPLFVDGMAQPIFPYTSGAVEEGYSNEDSDIIRFFVYVETNYDTDGDGQLDLVKALVQLPRAAAEGSYQAAVIYEARPYITGCTYLYGYDEEVYGEDGYDISSMYSQPDARDTATSTITNWEEAEDFVNAADSSEWYYYNEYEDMMDYEDLDWYDYYLVRGFAVVECGGIGTNGSEGFETCGSDLEVDAFKCVIEWLNGTSDRAAYTDATATTKIEAYWSNGNIGMTGRSYAGTTQFALATTGVEGLKTIVPVAGISSWYEYTNSQGISTRSDVAYVDALAGYCAGRMLDEEDWESIVEDYGNYLAQLRSDQEELNGDYGETWEVRDYTLDASNITCSALIVHGLNDYNVRTKMFEQMYDAFEEAGTTVKLLLHQDGHLTPSYPSQGIAFDIGDQSYNEILNKWFCYYLYDVDNGIVDELANVTVEDSHEVGVWNTYDSWDAAGELLLATEETDAEVVITSESEDSGVSRSNYQEFYSDSSTLYSAMYTTTVEDTFTIKGTVSVTFSATTSNVDEDATAIEERDALMVSAMLIDIAPEGETFEVFNTSGSYVDKTTLEEDGSWMGGGLENYDLTIHNTTEVSYKVISRGWMDLANPDAGFTSSSASVDTKVELGDEYEYTIYLQSNVYEVEEGHTLALVIYTYEPGMTSYEEDYQITIVNDSISVSIPVDDEEDAGTLLVTYDEEISNKIAVSADISGWYGGSVTLEGADESGIVEAGTEVTITVTVDEGFVFTGWTVNGEDLEDTSETITLTIEEGTTVVANIEEEVTEEEEETEEEEDVA